jgi:hypothetical protein
MPRTPLSTASRGLAFAAALALPFGLAVASEGAGPGAVADTGAVLAQAAGGPPAVGDRLGTTTAEIATTLEAAGHRVREIEREGDRFEVEIGRDGRGHEIYVDAGTGLVTKVERKN